MSNDSPRSRARGVINKLLLELRNKLEPSDKSAKEDQYYKKIKKLKHNQTKSDWACEAIEEMPLDKFATFVEGLQERYSLPDTAKKSILDILISKERHASSNQFTFSENSEITMFSMECIGMIKNQKVDLAFAMYNLHFKVDISSETESCTLGDSMEKAFCKLYQIRLYNYVKTRCI